MKTLSKDVCQFRVKVVTPSGACWHCDVYEIPQADMTADTVEKSERTETYMGESDEYHVEVFNVSSMKYN